MNAPDKIYLEKFPSGTLGVVWNENVEDCGGNEPIQYIRKEALLEWEKGHQEGERQGSYIWSCFQIIIDKLNSL